jgi:hypothetical protein
MLPGVMKIINHRQLSFIFDKDEAARVPESANWPMIEQFLAIDWKNLVGHPDQQPPVVQSNEYSNPFVNQLRIS